MARSILDSPFYIGSVLTLYGLAWLLNRNDDVMMEAEGYGEPPIMPEPYEFDDTSLPDMMLSYDPHTAIRPYFLKAEEEPTADEEDGISPIAARLALRDLVWAGPSFVNRYGLTQAPYSFYDTTGEFREDPGHDLTFSPTARLFPKKVLFAEDEDTCSICGSPESKGKLWYTGKTRGLVCQVCYDNRKWWRAESFSAEYTDISGTEMHNFLRAQGFRVVPHPIAKERIYEKPYGPNYVIRVYSSVVGNQSRSVGKDAIRVQPVYRDSVSGEEAYLSVHKRVHRVKGWKENLQKRINDILKIKPQVVRDSNGKPMVLRKARRGVSKGSYFYGSRDYPRNKETRRYTNPLI